MILRRLFPHPFLSALLVAIWMLLVNRFSWGSLTFALFLGDPDTGDYRALLARSRKDQRGRQDRQLCRAGDL